MRSRGVWDSTPPPEPLTQLDLRVRSLSVRVSRAGPGPRYAGNLSRQPRLPSLSPCTGSRPGLPGLTRQGGKHTLQRPKAAPRRIQREGIGKNRSNERKRRNKRESGEGRREGGGEVRRGGGEEGTLARWPGSRVFGLSVLPPLSHRGRWRAKKV